MPELEGVALILGTFRLLAVDHFDVTRLLLNERMMSFAIAIAATADVVYQLAASNRRGRTAVRVEARENPKGWRACTGIS